MMNSAVPARPNPPRRTVGTVRARHRPQRTPRPQCRWRSEQRLRRAGGEHQHDQSVPGGPELRGDPHRIPGPGEASRIFRVFGRRYQSLEPAIGRLGVLQVDRSIEHGGGSGGAIYTDGTSYDLKIAGSDIQYNSAKAGGSSIFYVSNDRTGHLRIDSTTCKNNTYAPGGQPTDQHFQNYPGILLPGQWEADFYQLNDQVASGPDVCSIGSVVAGIYRCTPHAEGRSRLQCWQFANGAVPGCAGHWSLGGHPRRVPSSRRPR